MVSAGSFLVLWGPHLSRLRHLGWLQCGHGLTSRPLESSLPGCLEPLLGLLGYPAGGVSALSNGILRIRYCSYPFAKRFSPWGLCSDSNSFEVVNLRLSQCGVGKAGHHSLPEEVNDGPKVVRRRIRGKTPVHEVLGKVASPPLKRRKWLFLPGPSRGYQESSHFPRVGVG